MDGKDLKLEIINIGKRLYGSRLIVARGGNLSARVDKGSIFITATSASLGELEDKDIIKVELSRTYAEGPDKSNDIKNLRLSSEFPLHSEIYKNFKDIKTIIHCHPPLANAYFSLYDNLEILTFETKLFLGKVPVVKQSTPSITNVGEVIEKLETNNIVVIKNHGLVSMGTNFIDCLYLIESLEEAVKMAGVARLFKKETLDSFEKELKLELSKPKSDTTSDTAYEMFSKEHIQAIVDLVNKDEFIAEKGKELDLSFDLAIKLDGEDLVYKFNFQKGKIIKLDFDEDAPYVVSAPKQVWELIFAGKIDPFVATTQGKMKLKGHLGQLSRWYVPLTRLFELFKQVKFK